MAWRYTAKKGFIKITGGSSKKSLIQNRAEKLRREGYKVRVYEVKN